MELVVAIQSIDDIDLIKSPWKYENLTPYEQETCASFYEVIKNKLADVEPNRVYFGSEFCQYRLCKPKDLIKAFDTVRKYGYEFSFVTPYLSQSMIDLIERLLETLADHVRKVEPTKKVEVVCNDWGILHYVQSTFNDCFQPVLGRLLNKLIRDPRVTEHYNRDDAPQLARSQLKQASYSVDYYQQFIKIAGVTMIEFDNVAQGFEVNGQFEDFQTAIHFGYGCVATGRTCLVGSMHVEKENKFRGSVVCKQQCRHYTAEMINRHPRIDLKEQRVFQKGNSAFYQQNYEHMKEGLNHAMKRKVQRVIFSPRIPV